MKNIFAKLWKLTSSKQAMAIDDKGWDHFLVMMFVSVNIHHKLYESSFQG